MDISCITMFVSLPLPATIPAMFVMFELLLLAIELPLLSEMVRFELLALEFCCILLLYTDYLYY